MFDEKCELCDEGNEQGDEIAEYWDPNKEVSIVAHVGCIDTSGGIRLA